MARYEFPASFEQRRMWLLDQLDPGRATYNVPWVLWLDGPLDEDALTRAWAACVARHEALRTVFRDDGGVPVQVVDDGTGPHPLPVIELDGTPGEAEQRAREVLRELARAPFDLALGPLVRVHLLRLAPGRHALSLVAHHIVADGWSFRLLFAELAAGYAQATGEAQAAGDAQPAGAAQPAGEPSEPGLQYADFALWQAEHHDAGGYAEAEAFWRAELDGAPHELALPADHPYPDRERDAAATADASIAAETATALRRLAADHQTTLFAVVAAGYAALLSRLTGAEDLLVAVPVAARTRAETEPVVGLFVNTIALRADLHGNPTLDQLVDRLHAASARAQPHQELPFARLVELIRPERQRSRSPLVQVMCVVEDAWPPLDQGGLRWRPELVENGTGKFELELTMTDGPGELDGRLRYRTDLFDQRTARMLADGLRRVFTALAKAPGTRVSEVDILSPAVRELVTRTWPAGPANQGQTADQAPPPSLPALTAAACTGDRVVIRGSDGEFTGAELGARAGAIAAALAASGVRAQDTVAILLPRGARPLAALLGAWWAGAAYLPIDPGQPSQRIRAMLADAKARVLISDSADLGALLAEFGGDPPVLDLARTLPRVTWRRPGPTPPQAVANVLFTSGSTGRPKAVAVTHGSLARQIQAFGELVRLERADRVAAVSSFGFDITILDLLLPLLAGAQVIVADPDEARDGTRLRRMLTATGATVLQATPATWRMLTDAGGVPERVRLCLSGGEALPRDLADAVLHGTGVDARLWNLYGPTETTVWSTAGPVTRGPGPVDVGTAVPGDRVYVLDTWGNPVAPGVTGEVHIGGGGVSLGYVGAPGLTAARFLPDPFAEHPGQRLYRTGDLGRWLPSGRLEILGRTDRQMKIRGFRVEAGEIEAALRTHPDVADAVVMTVTGGAQPAGRLVAYVVTDSEDPSRALREHLRSLLPDYMIPAVFVPLTGLPRTASGKVDQRALPPPPADVATGGLAPGTPLETEIAGLFAAVLRRSEPVGALDNFFVLGGHSLTATRLMARIWTAYGVDLPVRTLFDDPTVAGLAAAVTAAGGDADRDAGGPGPTRDAGQPDLADLLDTLSDRDIDDLLRP